MVHDRPVLPSFGPTPRQQHDKGVRRLCDCVGPFFGAVLDVKKLMFLVHGVVCCRRFGGCAMDNWRVEAGCGCWCGWCMLCVLPSDDGLWRVLQYASQDSTWRLLSSDVVGRCCLSCTWQPATMPDTPDRTRHCLREHPTRWQTKLHISWNRVRDARRGRASWSTAAKRRVSTRDVHVPPDTI